MAEVPQNQRLYAMVVMQAKAKYRVYPSPGASHWVHKRYLELGGKFIDSEVENRKKQIIRHMLQMKHERMAKHHGHHKEHGDKD
jgi:hypothetical protein